MSTGPEMPELENETSSMSERQPAHYLLAFAVGTLVGMGIASIWIPDRRRSRLPDVVRRRYRSVRKVGGSTLDEVRRAGQEVAGEFREELGATLEAARQELADMVHQQLQTLRGAVRRER